MNLGHFSKLEYQVDLLISTIRQLEDDKLSLEGEVRQLKVLYVAILAKPFSFASLKAASACSNLPQLPATVMNALYMAVLENPLSFASSNAASASLNRLCLLVTVIRRT